MNDDEEHPALTLTLTLRPLPSSPWLTQAPHIGTTRLDLHGMLPIDTRIREIALNGRVLKARITGDHPHVLSVEYFPAEGQRLTVRTWTPPAARRSPRPSEGPQRRTEGVLKGLVAARQAAGLRVGRQADDLRVGPAYGLLPAGARV